MGRHTLGTEHQSGTDQLPASWVTGARRARDEMHTITTGTPATPITKHDGTQTRR